MYYNKKILICAIIILISHLLFNSCARENDRQTYCAKLSPFTTTQFEKIVDGFIALAPGNYFRDTIFIDVNIDNECDYYKIKIFFEIGPSSLSSIQLDRYRGFIKINDTVFLLIFTDTPNTKTYNILFREQFIDTNSSILKQLGTLYYDYDPFVFNFHMYDDTILVFDGLSAL